jgi:hypothetical protein
MPKRSQESIVHRDLVVEAIATLCAMDRQIAAARLLLAHHLPLRHELAHTIDLELQRRLAREEKEQEL